MVLYLTCGHTSGSRLWYFLVRDLSSKNEFWNVLEPTGGTVLNTTLKKYLMPGANFELDGHYTFFVDRDHSLGPRVSGATAVGGAQ